MMNFIRFLIIKLIVTALVVLLVWTAFFRSSTRPGPTPPDPTPPATSARLLILYDADNKIKLSDKGAQLDSPALRTWFEKHHVDWRIVPSTAVFNDDQPEFQKLDAQDRKGDNWLFLDNGRLRGKVSQALPANEDATEKLIGGYVK